MRDDYEESYFYGGSIWCWKKHIRNKISNSLNIPFYSAGDLISEINKETYGANKVVRDKHDNQNILIKAVESKLSNEPSIILAGHFCIFNKDNEVEYIPEFVFQQIYLTQIVLLEAESEIIRDNLRKRDDKEYSKELINKLIKLEHDSAEKIANKLNIPLVIHKMQFNQSDLSIIEGVRL